MGFIKKAMLVSGVPVRPSTKRERSQKANIRAARTLERQTQLMEEQAQAQRARQQPPGPRPQPSLADELAKLGHLVQTGVISPPEFEAAKARLLGSPPVLQQSVSPQLPPEGWWPDPSGRFDRRYFDGQRWTEHVTRDAEQRQYTDPLT